MLAALQVSKNNKTYLYLFLALISLNAEARSSLYNTPVSWILKKF